MTDSSSVQDSVPLLKAGQGTADNTFWYLYWQQNALTFAYGLVFWHRPRIPKDTRQIDSFLNPQCRLSMPLDHSSGDYDFLVVGLHTGCSALVGPIFVYIAYCNTLDIA
jgi:hypothetical protein